MCFLAFMIAFVIAFMIVFMIAFVTGLEWGLWKKVQHHIVITERMNTLQKAYPTKKPQLSLGAPRHNLPVLVHNHLFALHRLLLLSPLFREVNFQQPRPRYQPEDPSSYRSPRPAFQTQYRTDFQSRQSSACFEWTGCPSKWRYSRVCTTALRHLVAEGLHNLESFGQCGDSVRLHLPPRSGSRGTG